MKVMVLDVPALIVDPERRATFLLAFLRRCPKTSMLMCCGSHAPVCFKCKSEDW
jgi:hypothetical protein